MINIWSHLTLKYSLFFMFDMKYFKIYNAKQKISIFFSFVRGLIYFCRLKNRGKQGTRTKSIFSGFKGKKNIAYNSRLQLSQTPYINSGIHLVCSVVIYVCTSRVTIAERKYTQSFWKHSIKISSLDIEYIGNLSFVNIYL